MKLICKAALSMLMACLLMIAAFPNKTAQAASFDPHGTKRYVGIDVSKWQGEIDYAKVKAAGVEIVYMRAGQGSNYVDPYFKRNYDNATAQGLCTGFYHFVTARTVAEAKEQARFFASIIKGREPHCRLVGDFEYFKGMTKESFNKVVQAFLDETAARTGLDVAIYTSASAARDRFSRETAKKYPLWVAEYGVKTPKPNGNWTEWIGWQYSNTGRVDGVRGNVDRDVFTEGVLLSDIQPEPTPETEYIVQRGDTLSKIARRFGVTVQSLVETNSIENPNLIRVGQRLMIPKQEETERTYTVQKGDTLGGIAKRFQTTVRALAERNNIANPNLIHVGQELVIPKQEGETANTYTVQKGDTLSRIAARFGTTAANLAEINNLQNPSLIHPGQVLRIM